MRILILCFSFLLSLLGGMPAAWCATVTSAPATITAAGITYIARAGDTLSSIAQQFTAKGENWLVLGKLNNIAKDTNIPIGTSIVIPSDLLADDPSEAKVAALSGSITATPAGKAPVLLGLGAKITEGMHIETGNNSFLTLSLPDQSHISVPSNSRIKIIKLRTARYTKSPRTEIMLLKGRVESHVAPLEQNKGLFEIHSPLAVAGVRGTHFRVSVTDSGSSVTEVLSGNVAVAQAGQPIALTLHAGQGDIIDAKSVGKAVNLLPTPQLADSPARQEHAAAQFTVTPVAGASAYHVQISSDQDAQDILSEGRSASTHLKIEGIPNGDYFARVSAIDKSGLEGPASTHAFTLENAAQPPSNSQSVPNAPVVDRNDNKQLSLHWAATGQKFTVQVAHDQAFTWLLYNSDTTKAEAHLPRPAFGTYYVRVRTINADGSVSPYSLAQPFVVTDQWIIHDGNPVSTQ